MIAQGYATDDAGTKNVECLWSSPACMPVGNHSDGGRVAVQAAALQTTPISWS